ncbi:MAG: FlgD immunoglobulin-like domain containing protein [Gaiellaceae bacterium]
MSRLGPAALVVALLSATTVAFVVTERLKLELSPISRTEVTKGAFSPSSTLVRHRCHCIVRRASIRFRLRKSERVTISILSDGQEIRRLLNSVDRPAGFLRVQWDGRNSSGRYVPDGDYRVRVRLSRSHRTILLPNVISLDRTPPRITALAVRPRLVSPDGDQRSDAARIRYQLSEPGWVTVYVDGKQTVRGKHSAQRSLLYWRGQLDGKLRLGRHRLTFSAQDLAGNTSAAGHATVVHVRLLTLRPQTQRVKAGTRFSLLVSTDRTSVTWQFAGRSGRLHAGGGRVLLRAPAKPGRRLIVVQAGPYRKAATVLVVPRR